jgi:hypothetical protein
MEEIEHKLKWFEKHCKALAEKEKIELEKIVENEVGRKVEEELKQEDERLANREQKEKEKLKQHFFEQVFDEKVKGKKKIYETELILKAELVQEVKEKLKKFTCTPEYDFYMKSSLESVLKEIKGCRMIRFSALSKELEKWRDWFNQQGENQWTISEIKALEEDKIGGWIIETERKVFDNTLLTNIKEKVYGTKENYPN